MRFHCGCYGNKVTIAVRYEADAYSPKEPSYQIWTQYDFKTKKLKSEMYLTQTHRLRLTGLMKQAALVNVGSQFRRLAQEDYQIDFFQESSVTFIRNRSFFEWRFIK